MITQERAREILVAAGVRGYGDVEGGVAEVGRAGDVPLWGGAVNGERAFAAWRAIRARTEETGAYPVIVTGDALTEDYATGEAAEDALREAAELEVWAGRLGKMGKKSAGEYGLDEGEDRDGEGDEGEGEEDGNDEPVFNSLQDLDSGAWRNDLAIVLLPTKVAWEAAAWLGTTAGVNLDIMPPQQVAAAKRWHAAYGAELVVCASDTLEYVVARPPETAEAALALAYEQYGLCPDIIEQGYESVGELARALRGARSWFFWWD